MGLPCGGWWWCLWGLINPAGAGLDAHRAMMGLSSRVAWPSGQPARPRSKLGVLGAVGRNPTPCFGQSIRSPLPISFSFPCAIGVSKPVSNFVFYKIPYARTAIAVNAFAVNSFIGLIIRPLGQKDNAETISAVLDGVVGGVGIDVVHVSIPHGPFLLLGRTDVGAVAIIRPTLTYSVLAPIFFVAIKKYY
jgi:hypothetical protein